MTRVFAAAFPAAWYGFAVVARRPQAIDADYWALARTEGGWRIELGGCAAPADWQDFARRLFGSDGNELVELLAYRDADKGRHRFAAFADGRPLGLLYVAAEPVEVSRTWACGQFAAGVAEDIDRCGLLAGRATLGLVDPGPIVCSCFAVGRNQILTALGGMKVRSVDGVAAATSAGSNCGSCRAEIQGLIDRVPAQAAE